MGYVQRQIPFLFQYGISRIHDKRLRNILTSQEEQKKRFFTCFRNDNHVILNGTKCSEESPAMIAGGDSSYSFEMTSSISGSLTGGFLAYARNDRRGTTRTRAELFK